MTADLHLTHVGRVCVTISDTDRALEFYAGKLGFKKVVDTPMGPGMRWVEVEVAGAQTTIALSPPPDGRTAGNAQTGIVLESTDLAADHAALQVAGADIDAEISNFGGPVPPMVWLRDPDGNSIIIVQA